MQLSDIQQFSIGFPIILIIVVLAGLGQVLIKKILGKENIAECHEVGGNYMQVVGTLYAVVLGLIVYNAMNRFEQAKIHAGTEATSLMQVYLMTKRMPQEYREPLKESIENYINAVIEDEWQRMAQGERSEKARAYLLQASENMLNIEPVTNNQEVLLASMISSMQIVWQERKSRLDFVDFKTPKLEWIILLIGAGVTVFFTYFFSMSNSKIQFILTGLVTLIVALNLYLVLQFGEPYSGSLSVSSNSFQAIRDQIHSKIKTP
jgi:hypothetical protein